MGVAVFHYLSGYFTTRYLAYSYLFRSCFLELSINRQLTYCNNNVMVKQQNKAHFLLIL
jgi:hypothetical protein